MKWLFCWYCPAHLVSIGFLRVLGGHESIFPENPSGFSLDAL